MTFSTAFNSTPIIFAQDQICGDTASSQNRLWIYSLVVSCGFMVFMVPKPLFWRVSWQVASKRALIWGSLDQGLLRSQAMAVQLVTSEPLVVALAVEAERSARVLPWGQIVTLLQRSILPMFFLGLDRELSVGIAFCNHYRAPSNPYNPRRCDCCRASIGTVSQELGAPKSRPWSFGSWPGVDL
jgi:hypothetical protein